MLSDDVELCQKIGAEEDVVCRSLLLSMWVIDAQEAVARAWHFANSPVKVFIGTTKPKEITVLPLLNVFANKCVDTITKATLKVAALDSVKHYGKAASIERFLLAFVQQIS